MKFTPQELMFIFDAVCTFSILPHTQDLPGMEPLAEKIAAKVELQLADMGFTLDADYVVTS